MLGTINDRLNTLAWELASQNEQVGDPNVARAINTLDEALENLQVATALLNTIAVDPALLEEKEDVSEPKAKSGRGGLLKRKASASSPAEPKMNAS
ncbi:MAG: hypothetical protein ACON4P_01750 [Candidatus Puniceispirillales bacterium]